MIRSSQSALIVLVVALTILITPACAARGDPSGSADAARAAVTDAAFGVAGVVAHTESAERHVQKAVPHTDRTGKIHLSAATDEHQAVMVKAEQARGALDTAATRVTALESQIVAARVDYTALESRWYVTWGRRIERALWVIGVSWLVLGIASVIFGLGNPLSWTWRIGKEITRLVPLMNPFSWVRDWILRRRVATVVGSAGKEG
jgi:hypothetical protein